MHSTNITGLMSSYEPISHILILSYTAPRAAKTVATRLPPVISEYRLFDQILSSQEYRAEMKMPPIYVARIIIRFEVRTFFQ